MEQADLIARYLQAVAFWLPAKQKTDIAAELSADIHAQIEEREGSAGRTLTQAEVEELLKQRGAPILVANRYLPQRSLIGPLLFPIYVFVMKIVACCYLVPWVAVWIVLVVCSPVYRATHTGANWLDSLGSFWGSLWSTTFVSLAVVTLVFAILEQTYAKTRFLEKWEPGKLPAVVIPNQIPRSSSLIEVVANLVFAWWWVTFFLPFGSLHFFKLTVTMSPAWGYYFWGYLVLALANSALAATNLMRRYWTTARASARLVSDAIGAGLFCWLLKGNFLVSMALPGLATDKAAILTAAINHWANSCFPCGVVVGVVIAGFNIDRIYRVVRPASKVDGGVSVSNVPRQHL